MTKYKIASIRTLTGELKTDKSSVNCMGKIGYLQFCTISENASCMIFVANDDGYTGFVTSKIVSCEEYTNKNIHEKIITTQNSIYFMEEVCD